MNTWRRGHGWRVILGGLLLVLLSLFGSRLQAQEQGLAARVNGVPISVFRLERHFEDYLKERGRNLGALRSPVVYKRLKRDALDELIDRELLWQEAQRRGVTVPPERLQQALAQAESTARGPEAFRRRLQAAGFDEAGYRDYLAQSLAGAAALDALIDEALQRDPVPEAELQAIYQQNKERFVRPAGPLSEAEAMALLRVQVAERRRGALAKQVREQLRATAKLEVFLSL